VTKVCVLEVAHLGMAAVWVKSDVCGCLVVKSIIINHVGVCLFGWQQSKYKVINRDQWCNVLEFSRMVAADLSNYDEDGACMSSLVCSLLHSVVHNFLATLSVKTMPVYFSRHLCQMLTDLQNSFTFWLDRKYVIMYH